MGDGLGFGIFDCRQYFSVNLALLRGDSYTGYVRDSTFLNGMTPSQHQYLQAAAELHWQSEHVWTSLSPALVAIHA